MPEQINRDFYNYLKPYLVKLRQLIGDDWIVFGSAPLYLLGVVEFAGKVNDLDVNLRDVLRIPVDAQVVTFQGNKEQRFHKIFIDDLEVDIGTAWPGFGGYMENIYEDPIVVDGFKFANLDIVEQWKEEMVRRYDRKKDKDYLVKINEYKDKNAKQKS
jgi:hypothetical protein